MVRLTCAVPCLIDGKPWTTDDVSEKLAETQFNYHMNLVHKTYVIAQNEDTPNGQQISYQDQLR